VFLVRHDILHECRLTCVTFSDEHTHSIVRNRSGVEFLQLKIHSTVVARFIYQNFTHIE